MYKNEPVKKLADSHGPVIIPFKVMNRIFITLNGIITRLLSANRSYGLVFIHDKLLGLRPRVYHLSQQT